MSDDAIKLHDKVLAVICTKGRHGRYPDQVVLDALVLAVVTAFYNCAADKGAGLRGLQGEFIARLIGTVIDWMPDAEYHRRDRRLPHTAH